MHYVWFIQLVVWACSILYMNIKDKIMLGIYNIFDLFLTPK